MTIMADRGSKASGTTREYEPPPDLPNVVAAQEHYLYGFELQASAGTTSGAIRSAGSSGALRCKSNGQLRFADPIPKSTACSMS